MNFLRSQGPPGKRNKLKMLLLADAVTISSSLISIQNGTRTIEPASAWERVVSSISPDHLLTTHLCTVPCTQHGWFVLTAVTK